FEIEVAGLAGYVGSRHRLPYDNPIATAAHVVTAMELWLNEYTERHRTSTSAPQGAVGAIHGGWTRMPAAIPASCRIRLDVRIAPGESPAALRRELADRIRS